MSMPLKCAHGDGAAFVAQASVVHRLPEFFDAPRVFAQQKWFQTMHLGDDAVGVVFEKGFTNAADACIGVDEEPNPTGRHFENFKMGDFHGGELRVANCELRVANCELRITSYEGEVG